MSGVIKKCAICAVFASILGLSGCSDSQESKQNEQQEQTMAEQTTQAMQDTQKPHKNTTKPNIVILATGGTIAGAVDSSLQTTGYQAGVLSIESLLQSVPELADLANLESEQIANIDSADMSDEIWLTLAKRVNALLKSSQVDGVVITHGTDTMEESAFFLHLVAKSDKPIVFVGAMRPSSALSADGPKNLYNAISLAANPKSKGKGVMVVMNDRIQSARYVSKIHTLNVNAFASAKSDKPIVFVGAMRPSSALSADGPKNLYNAISLAANPKSKGKGVMVVMNDRIQSARYVSKIHTLNVNAFASPNTGDMGYILDGKAFFYTTPSKPHTLQSEFDIDKLDSLPKVDILYSYANDNSQVAAQALFNHGTKGLIIAGSGAGSIHKNHKDMLKKSADGPKNLYNAISLAANPKSQGKGVMVVMNDRIQSARYVSKIHTLNVNAFASPNAGDMGYILDGKAFFYTTPSKPHTLQSEFDIDKLDSLPKVDILYSYANDNSQVAAQALFNHGTKGLVIAGSGAGSIHKNHKDMLKKLMQNGLVVVQSSRINNGLVIANEADSKLGFISGYDLNPQKARVLLMLALSKTDNNERIAKIFETY